jgi:hypothetical protein
MAKITKRPLKAFVRFDGTGRIVPSSLILRRKKPKVGKWQEIPAYQCCNDILPSNCIEFVANTTLGGTLFDLNIIAGNLTYTVDWGDGVTEDGSITDVSITLTHDFPSSDTAYTVRICFSDASFVTSLDFVGND